jgi:hypothetical protein
MKYTDYEARVYGSSTSAANMQFFSMVLASAFTLKNAVLLRLRPDT